MKHWTEALEDGKLLYSREVNHLDGLKARKIKAFILAWELKSEEFRAEKNLEREVLKQYSPDEIQQAKMDFLESENKRRYELVNQPSN